LLALRRTPAWAPSLPATRDDGTFPIFAPCLKAVDGIIPTARYLPTPYMTMRRKSLIEFW